MWLECSPYSKNCFFPYCRLFFSSFRSLKPFSEFPLKVRVIGSQLCNGYQFCWNTEWKIRICPFKPALETDLSDISLCVLRLSFTDVVVYDICRLQTADRRLQTADRRLQTADCRYFCAKLHWPHSQNAVGYSSPTLYHLTRHITNCIDSSFFFDYRELIMTSSNAH